MPILQLHSLSSKFISTKELDKLFGGNWKKTNRGSVDDRFPHRFIVRNQKTLSWLGVSVRVAEENNTLGIMISTSNIIGSVPLRDPQTGKYKLDIVVKSRFNEDIASLIELLDTTISPEFLDVDLVKAETVRAPIYFDCINYIQAFSRAITAKWHRFSVKEKIEPFPKGTTNWTKHAQTSYDPQRMLQYPNRNNTLQVDHPSWLKLCYVLKSALEILQANNIPLNVRLKYREQIERLQQYLREHKPIYTRDAFHISPQDPVAIKELKGLANVILTLNRKNAKAWRIDSSQLFERYVQYICTLVVRRIGGVVQSNPKISIKGSPYLPGWSLKYLEPDMVMRLENMTISIDAKYKAHMLNNTGEELKDSFRSDLHQVLAYSSFSESADKIACIFYPYSYGNDGQNRSCIKTIRLDMNSRISTTNITTYLFGISINVTDIPQIVDQLTAEISKKLTRAV